MIEPDQDTRVIEQDAEAYNATLVAREDIGPDLGYFRVKLDGPPFRSSPGQYMTIGVIADGKLLQRPYSVASAPTVSDTDGYEFFVRHVPVVRFTTALWRLPVGQRMRMIGPKGKFMLEPGRRADPPVRVHRHRHRPVHLDGPRDDGPGQAAQDRAPQRRLVRGRAGLPVRAGGMAAGSGLPPDLRADGLPAATTHGTQAGPAGWAAPSRWSTDTCRDLGLEADTTVVYICGNPEMILNVERVLIERGFPEFHVKKELYWPKGKAPAAV